MNRIAAVVLVVAFASMPAESGECPNGNDEPTYPTCDFRLALQNAYSNFDLSPYGVNNEAWVVGGSALYAGHENGCDPIVDPDECVQIFLNYTETQIRNKLQNYIDSKPFLATTSHLLILNLEPSGVHPRTLSNFEGVYYPDNPAMDVRDRAILAFALRIRVARELMPEAKLSIFGVGVFSANGRGSDLDDRRLASYQRGGELGLYDDLDFITPVLYIRYGPSDFPTHEEFMEVVEQYTRNTIERSQQLRRNDGSPLMLAPFLSNKVFRGTNSPHEGEPVDVLAGKTQLLALKDYSSVGVVVFWSGLDQEAYPLIPSYFQNVKPVPSYCFCSQSPAARDDETRFLACMDPRDQRQRKNPPICFQLGKASRVTLTLYSTGGQRIRKLIDEDRVGGVETVEWDRRNDAGELVASGIYVAVLETEGKKIMTKIPVIK